jgi:hypothetical protein
VIQNLFSRCNHIFDIREVPMKRILYISIVVLFLLNIAGCKNDDGSSSFTSLLALMPKVLFEDDFSYNVADPWTPVNGWTEYTAGYWGIVAGGVSGNALEYNGNTSSGLINDATCSDCIISVKVKPVQMNYFWPFIIVGRFQDSANYYYFQVLDDSSDVWIKMYSRVSGIETIIGSDLKAMAGHLDPDTYYTMSLKLDGDNLKGTFSDGTTTAAVTGTDTTFTDGKFGLWISNTTPGYIVQFDDFKVRGL